jgi:agmatinase
LSYDAASLRFLDLPPEWRDPATARYEVVCAPYEHTVSYGRGTAGGPAAILVASQQLELVDGAEVPARAGIVTGPALAFGTDLPDRAVAKIRDAVRTVLDNRRVPIMLGGEHTVSLGALQACHDVHGEFGVVQFDAHADLRDTFRGSTFSHGCVMRRALDLGLPVFQIGVRSYSLEEVPLREGGPVRHLDAVEIARRGVPRDILPPDFPRRIYLTFDVDALDPAVVPGTGTPEPGGLSWYDALDAIEAVVCGRETLAADVVELAPVPGSHVSDFAVARLVYSIIGRIERARG